MAQSRAMKPVTCVCTPKQTNPDALPMALIAMALRRAMSKPTCANHRGIHARTIIFGAMEPKFAMKSAINAKARATGV
jgi:hypothetical protein